MNEQAVAKDIWSAFNEIGRTIKKVVQAFTDLVMTIAEALRTKDKRNEEKAQRNMRNGWGLFSAKTYKDTFTWAKKKIGQIKEVLK